MPLLQIVTVSTREGRKGPLIAEWFEQEARDHGKFALESIDLQAVNLPMMNEPEHPRMRRYHHEHTRQWSATVDRADAFVFVIPEYNFSAPPSFVNAMDYLVHEWGYKPVGFVSYGGISGGTRGVQVAKQLVTTLRMMPMVEAVALPMFAQAIDAATGKFQPPDVQSKAAHAMLSELLRWTNALEPLRRPATS